MTDIDTTPAALMAKIDELMATPGPKDQQITELANEADAAGFEILIHPETFEIVLQRKAA